jgi:TPR repeat protein
MAAHDKQVDVRLFACLNCLPLGIEVPVNWKEATEYFWDAAGQGLPASEFCLAYCHEHGKGAQPSLVEAARQSKQAADGRSRDA